ncbi:MAG: DUF1194 domain-containing protein [Rhodospirillales bacterium]|nr:DUF1194 domain-containing protein [Rhodospirillales bacterium]MBO6785641.1 DUF1194 domain-containing protein [Rhodospirillales bacterium]
MLVLSGRSAIAQEGLVDLELVIAVDISGSVDDDEAYLQRQGYIKAFRDPKVVEAITRGPLGAIAVTYFEYAGSHHQMTLVDWTFINSQQTANEFADALAFEPILVNVWTSISGAILAGVDNFSRSPFKGKRRVVDISGDGANNDGPPVNLMRDRALKTGITINGLPIVNDKPSRYGRRQIPNLDYYYIDCVIGGPGAFIIVANGFEDYARAVRRKLILEIAGAEPANQPRRPQTGIVPAYGHDRPPCNVGENLRQDWDDF